MSILIPHIVGCRARLQHKRLYVVIYSYSGARNKEKEAAETILLNHI